MLASPSWVIYIFFKSLHLNLKIKTQRRSSGRLAANAGDEREHEIFEVISERVKAKHHRALTVNTDMLPHHKVYIKDVLLPTLLLAFSSEWNTCWFTFVLFMVLIPDYDIITSYFLRSGFPLCALCRWLTWVMNMFTKIRSYTNVCQRH